MHKSVLKMAETDIYHKVKMEDILEEILDVKSKTDKIEILKKGATNKKISALETRIKLQLPPDYKSFLKFSDGAEVFGLSLCSVDQLYNIPVIYEDNSGNERKLNQLYRIGFDGSGFSLLMNLNLPSGAKDPNRRDILDSGMSETRVEGTLEVIAKSFGEFLYRIIDGSKKQSRKYDWPRKQLIEDPEIDRSMFWLDPEFKPYREYAGVEQIDDILWTKITEIS